MTRSGAWSHGLLDTLVWGRALDLYQRASGRTCTVLLYHSVATGAHNPYLDAETYGRHMDMLAAEFRVLSADEYLWHLDRGRRYPPRSVLVTFDDGYRNNALVVQPIMQQRSLPWILFTTTELLDEPGRPLWAAALRAACLFTSEMRVRLLGQEWELGNERARLGVYRQVVARLAASPSPAGLKAVRAWAFERYACAPGEYAERFCSMLSADELRGLAASPLVEIGCHTRTHPFLTGVSDDILLREIDGSAAALSELLGLRIRMFAYPQGSYGQREVTRVMAAGFDCGFALIPALGRVPRFEIPRVGIYHSSVTLSRAKALGLADVLRSVGLAVG